MIDFGPHAGFILAAYGITVVVTLGVVLWVILDGRALRRRIAELEARGVRRRSARPSNATVTPTATSATESVPAP